EPALVPAGEVLAEDEVERARQHGPHAGRCAAPVAPVVPGEGGRCVGGVHGGRPQAAPAAGRNSGPVAEGPAVHDRFAARAAGGPGAIGGAEEGESTSAEGGACVLIVDLRSAGAPSAARKKDPAPGRAVATPLSLRRTPASLTFHMGVVPHCRRQACRSRRATAASSRSVTSGSPGSRGSRSTTFRNRCR